MLSEKINIYDRYECALFRKTNEKFGGLSNMASGYPLTVNGVPIGTSEALYQACRFPTLPEVQRKIIEQKSPMAAKMVGKPFRAQTRADWDDVRVRIMRWSLRIKLAQNWSSFGELLLSTEEMPIVEVSDRDEFWGAIPQADETLIGKNVLGRLLGELRNDLRKPNAECLKYVAPVPIAEFLLYSEAIQPVSSAESGESLSDPDIHSSEATLWQLPDK